MKPLMLICLLLASCATQRPKSHTPTPALDSTKRGVTDAKEFLSRGIGTNAEIDRELDALERELDSP